MELFIRQNIISLIERERDELIDITSFTTTVAGLKYKKYMYVCLSFHKKQAKKGN